MTEFNSELEVDWKKTSSRAFVYSKRAFLLMYFYNFFLHLKLLYKGIYVIHKSEEGPFVLILNGEEMPLVTLFLGQGYINVVLSVAFGIVIYVLIMWLGPKIIKV